MSQHRNETGADAVAPGDSLGDVFFARATGRQVLDRTASRFGLAQRSFFELGRQTFSVGAEVLEKDAPERRAGPPEIPLQKSGNMERSILDSRGGEGLS